jgi:glucose-6-phosphate-specific signal transduction histidine kinase
VSTTTRRDEDQKIVVGIPRRRMHQPLQDLATRESRRFKRKVTMAEIVRRAVARELADPQPLVDQSGNGGV